MTADLAKRDWLLTTLTSLAALSHPEIERRGSVTSAEFLDRYYSMNQPVILTDAISGWPALYRWSEDYFREHYGDKIIECQGERNDDPDYEPRSHLHKQKMTFAYFLDAMDGNDRYMVATNSGVNIPALEGLYADCGHLPYLTPDKRGYFWCGPAGTHTPWHHDLTNNLLAQVVGRKRVQLVPAGFVGRMENYLHVYSRIENPAASGITVYDFVLGPGEVLFLPIGWWHAVTSLDFSVTISYTNFIWRNDWYSSFPSG